MESPDDRGVGLSRPEPVLVPARMINEYAYCPRLAYLDWVQGEFAHNSDTLEGRFEHRRVARRAIRSTPCYRFSMRC